MCVLSLIVLRFIQCDVCGTNNGGDDRTESTHRIRMGRKSMGWKVGPPKDYCPECFKKPKALDAAQGENP